LTPVPKESNPPRPLNRKRGGKTFAEFCAANNCATDETASVPSLLDQFSNFVSQATKAVVPSDYVQFVDPLVSAIGSIKQPSLKQDPSYYIKLRKKFKTQARDQEKIHNIHANIAIAKLKSFAFFVLTTLYEETQESGSPFNLKGRRSKVSCDPTNIGSLINYLFYAQSRSHLSLKSMKHVIFNPETWVQLASLVKEIKLARENSSPSDRYLMNLELSDIIREYIMPFTDISKFKELSSLVDISSGIQKVPLKYKKFKKSTAAQYLVSGAKLRKMGGTSKNKNYSGLAIGRLRNNTQNFHKRQLEKSKNKSKLQNGSHTDSYSAFISLLPKSKVNYGPKLLAKNFDELNYWPFKDGSIKEYNKLVRKYQDFSNTVSGSFVEEMEFPLLQRSIKYAREQFILLMSKVLKFSLKKSCVENPSPETISFIDELTDCANDLINRKCDNEPVLSIFYNFCGILFRRLASYLKSITLSVLRTVYAIFCAVIHGVAASLGAFASMATSFILGYFPKLQASEQFSRVNSEVSSLFAQLVLGQTLRAWDVDPLESVRKQSYAFDLSTMGQSQIVKAMEAEGYNYDEIKECRELYVSKLQRAYDEKFGHAEVKIPLHAWEMETINLKNSMRDKFGLKEEGAFTEYSSKLWKQIYNIIGISVPGLEFEDLGVLEKDVKNLKQKLDFSNSAFRYLHTFFDISKYLIEKVQDTFTHYLSRDPILEDIRRQTVSWMEISERHMRPEVNKLILKELPLAYEVAAHFKHGMQLLTQLTAIDIKRWYLSGFLKVFDIYKVSAFAQAQTKISTTNSRSQPILLQMDGQPGVGKSVIIDLIISYLFKSKPTSDLKYVWSQGDDYQDAFAHQKVTVIDDIFVKSNPDDAAMLISAMMRMVNTESYPLLTADLNKKGILWFDSELIIATSNLKNFPVEPGVNDPNAFKRRRTIRVEVVRKPEHKIKFGTFDCTANLYNIRNTFSDDTATNLIATFTWPEFLKYLDFVWTNRQTIFLNLSSHITSAMETNFEATMEEIISGTISTDASKLTLDSEQYKLYQIYCRANNLNIDINVKDSVLPPDYEDLVLEQGEEDNNVPLGLPERPSDVILHKTLGSDRNWIYKVFLGMLDQSLIRAKCWVLDNKWVIAGMTVLAAAGVVALFKIYHDLSFWLREHNGSGDPHTQKVKINKVIPLKASDIQYEQMETLAYRGLVRKIEKNHVILQTVDYPYHTIHGVFFSQNILMIPKHFLRVIETTMKDRNAEVNMITTYGDSAPFKILRVKSYKLRDDDLAFIDMSTIFHKSHLQFKTIAKRLVKDETFIKFDSWKNNFARLSFTNYDIHEHVLSEVGSDLHFLTNVPVAHASLDKTYIVPRRITAALPSRAGLCGSLLIDTFTCEIIGMHLAGNGSVSSFAILTQTLWKAVNDYFLPTPPLKEEIEIQPSEIYTFIPNKTEIRPSLIHGLITDPITKPAHLRPFKNSDDIILSPVDIALSRLERRLDVDLNPDLVKRLNINLLDTLEDFNSSMIKKVSLETAINGIPGIIKSVNFQTSPGLPFVAMGLTKKDLIIQTKDNAPFEPTPLFMNYLEGSEKHVPVIWLDCLKDERLPIKKAEEGRTRLFSVCPLNFLVYARMYLLMILVFFQESRNFNSVLSGINPLSNEWDTFYRYYTSKLFAPKYIAGDYSSFDVTIPLQFCQSVFTIVSALCPKTEEYRHALRYIFDSIMYAQHQIGDKKYTMNGGNPSGQPFTTLYNSIINKLILSYCFVEYYLDNSTMNLTSVIDLLNNKTKIAVYGDDHIFFLDDSIEFNMMHLNFYISKMHMKYTTTTKESVNRNYVSHSDLTFLKRDFHFTTCGYVGRLDKTVIYEMINWVRVQNNISPTQALRAVLESALREAVLHGKSFYKKFRGELCESIAYAHISLRVPDPYTEAVVDHGIAYFE
jgi:hypothetical protein